MNLLRTSSQKRLFRSVIVYFLTFCMFFNASLPVVLAGPDGAVVVNGDVSIQQSGYNTTITASDRAIINYSSFDIARPEIVQFIQPDMSASVLNRILSANPTTINGTLLANGRVFFVNPAGVYFGNGAKVNVNQLVASALDIKDADFINGRYNFVGGEGSVINEGDIFAEKVYLIGRQVANSGSISCPAGYVVMASGDRVFLGEPGSDIVLEIDGPSLPESADPIEGSGVLNEGTVEAAGGTIVLAAAGDIYSQAISNVGSLSVSAQTGDGGQVELTANGGQITNSGTIDASGDNGGSVTIDGGNVALSADSVIHADAMDEGDGGEVLIYADNLDIDGVVTAAGIDGYILFDPVTLDIDQAAADAFEVSLAGTATVDVAADTTINLNGEIDSSIQTNNHTLNFKDDNANNDLTINLNDKIILGSNQTLTGDGTVINVASTGLIQNGIDVAATSATVTVSNGTYTEDLTVDKSNLTLKSVNGRDNTTIQLVDGVGIDIGSGGSGFVLGGGASDGFEITSSAATTFNVQLENAPSNVEISWNSFDTTNNSDNQGISIGAAGATGLNINNNTFKTDDVPGVGGVVWGDGSIWGPDMVDVSVTNNTFTGPAVLATSGYAVEFAGVTGNSFIQDNIISNYGMGIAIFNGTGTSGLTISGNQVSDSTNGIRLGQYSPGVNGDMTTVSVTENTLSNNTIGLRINNGANVKASNFTIQNNSFSGNTTGLANQHASEIVTAELNYWGSDNGPTHADNTFNVSSQGDTVTGNVDYVQWRQTSMLGPSFAPVENLMSGDLYASIQAGIDDASSDDDLRAEAGTFTENVHADDQIDVDFKAGDSVVDGTLTTEADCQITSSGSLRITGTVEAASNINTSTGLTFESTVTADGAGLQTFEAGGGTLHALNTITKTGTGGLNLTGNTLVDLDNTVDVQSAASDLVVTGTVVADGLLKATGDIDLKNGATLGGNVTSVGGNIDFRDTVSADGGAAQTFDAGGGTLHAWNTITKTGTGGLNLTANTLVDLDNTVDVQSAASDLVVTGTVVADGLLKATGDIDLKNGATLGGNVTSVGGNIDFRDTVSADGGDQVFDAEGGTLTTNNGISITKTTAGTLSLGGATALNLGGDVKATAAGGNLVFTDDVTASGAGSQEFDAEGGKLTAKSITKAAGDLTLGGATGIDIDGTVDVQGGNLALEDNTIVADDEMLKASGNVTVTAGKTLTAEGHLKVEATGGAITAGLITMQADDKTLTLTQNDAIDMADFSVTNDEDTDLVANSTDGSVTSMAADSWQSITAEAKDNIELSGAGDIKIAATGLLSHDGGVKVVSNGGSIYTPGAGGYLNAPITGYSDESADVGVDLIYPYWPEFGTKAAIVIWSPYKDLKIGPDATLTAYGTYDPTQFDDRLSFLVDFFTPTDLRGDPVDVAIYLGSNYSGNVEMGSGSVWIDNKSLTEIGTLAIDAYDTVTFTEAFENSLPGSAVRRLEVVSRISPDIDTAIADQTLPYADNPSLLADGLYLGTYVLRGRDLLFTQVLDKREEAPIVPPKLEEPEEQGAVEEPDMEALIALLEELGIGVQPHLARAYRHEKSGINTLNTDLRLFKAAEKLQKLIPMLEDTEGKRIAALRVVVGQFFSTLASISDEQMASFRQELARHVGDETDYDLAGESISALVKYVDILSTDIGWPMDKSMGFVMGRYIPRLTEGDAIRTAVVQMQLQEALDI